MATTSAIHSLRGCDAGFLYVENAEQPTTIPILIVLGPREGGAGGGRLTFDELRAHVAARVAVLPALRQRLVRAPLGLHRPFLVEDPAFDLDFHLRRRTVPSPGGPAELDRLVADGAERLIDRRHPLWQLTLVNGLADGSQALYLRIHHALTDGTAVRSLTRLLFSEDEVPGRPSGPVPPPDPTPVTRGMLVRVALAEHWQGLRRLPGLVVDTQAKLELLKAREAESSIPVPALVKDTPCAR